MRQSAHEEGVREERIQELERRWRAVAELLPGCKPYENRRPCRIKTAEDGLSFVEVLEGRFPGKLSREEWLAVFDEGLMLSRQGEVIRDAFLRVEAGSQYVRLLPGWVEPPVATDLRVIAEDEVLLIVDKPAPLSMHEGGRFHKNTLKAFMAEAWPELEANYTHRLDADTSGVLVCVKGRTYRNSLQKQFEEGAVKKRYLARVQGWPEWEEKLVTHPVSAEGREWGRMVEAETRLRVRSREEDGTTVIEVEPLTGRTHQIRVHLWQEGYPILNDRLYLPGGKRGVVEVADPGAQGLALRSWKISFDHPASGERVEYECEARI